MAVEQEDGPGDGLSGQAASAADSVKRGAEAGRRRLDDAAQDAGEAVRQQAESGKAQTADRLEGASGALRGAARQMRGQEPWLAGLIERGAEELGRLSEALRANDLRSLLDNVEDVAHRQPLLAVGAGFAAGFAAVRASRAGLAKASDTAAEWRRTERGDEERDDAAAVAEDLTHASAPGAAPEYRRTGLEH